MAQVITVNMYILFRSPGASIYVNFKVSCCVSYDKPFTVDTDCSTCNAVGTICTFVLAMLAHII
jgi:hypothetical protein